MIVQCPDCTTRYQLDPERVPPERIRVRCPKCRYVFPIDGAEASRPVTPLAVEPSRPIAVPPVEGFESTRVAPSSPAAPVTASRPVDPVDEPGVESVTPAQDSSSLDLQIERHSAAVTPARPTAPAPAESATESVGEVGVAVADEPVSPVQSGARPAVEPDDTEDPARKKARRLARALVSDILVYNRAARDKALAEGNLVQALGVEIKKSWELYKERVTPEVANSNNDFREALNEILADGRKIF